ncbi:MAG TPA: lactate racemase domain-containing protein [Deltaproteobacteria bacterium]|nr:lactate racemase domain-containing protein [Deltaproteobacteria bacterium]HQI80370.1 lactate racemase domain-containing protein [Deltaproteobacteria bacterium]
MKRISVPARLWFDNTERELTFPDRWEVTNLTSPGFEKPGLSLDRIREGIEHPVEGPSLEELARGRKRAVIVFDDMTRPTPVKDVAPAVLDILHRAGMSRDQIRFIWALGSHGACDMIHARKKLGDFIVENYAVYNHDPFQNVVRVGRTPTGVELWFNREYLDCDLKIGIGCITAHVHVGFGGGAKIIMPGVAGIETINQFHNQLFRDPARTGLGNFENNIMRAECDAAGDLTGLSFKIDCLINRRGQVADLFAGPFRATHSRGAEEAKTHYGIPFSTGYDIVVCNAYGKANESAIALLLSLQTMKPGQGTAVLISDAPDGQVPHYVMRQWGTEYGGRHYAHRAPGFVQLLMKKLVVLNPHPDMTGLDLVCHPDDAVTVKTWPEVLAILEQDFPDSASVAVIQDGTMQYLKQ